MNYYNDNVKNDIISATSLPDDVIDSLDLKPLMYEVASHSGTKRGRNALLSLANIDEEKDQQGEKIPLLF